MNGMGWDAVGWFFFGLLASLYPQNSSAFFQLESVRCGREVKQANIKSCIYELIPSARGRAEKTEHMTCESPTCSHSGRLYIERRHSCSITVLRVL